MKEGRGRERSRNEEEGRRREGRWVVKEKRRWEWKVAWSVPSGLVSSPDPQFCVY